MQLLGINKMRTPCKYCGKLIIPAFGQPSKILIAGEFAGSKEILKGVPFCGDTGDVLKQEAARAGFNVMSCRLTNLWCHAKDEENCDLDFHIKTFMQEAKDKKFILLMGSDLTQAFCGGKSVMDLTSMEVKSEFFPKARVFVSVNPAYLFHRPAGELRLAFKKFAEVINE